MVIAIPELANGVVVVWVLLAAVWRVDGGNYEYREGVRTMVLIERLPASVNLRLC
jgi:hypothetical protein